MNYIRRLLMGSYGPGLIENDEAHDLIAAARRELKGKPFHWGIPLRLAAEKGTVDAYFACMFLYLQNNLNLGYEAYKGQFKDIILRAYQELELWPEDYLKRLEVIRIIDRLVNEEIKPTQRVLQVLGVLPHDAFYFQRGAHIRPPKFRVWDQVETKRNGLAVVLGSILLPVGGRDVSHAVYHDIVDNDNEPDVDPVESQEDDEEDAFDFSKHTWWVYQLGFLTENNTHAYVTTLQELYHESELKKVCDPQVEYCPYES